MKFGPFSKSEIEEILVAVKAQGISVDVTADVAELEAKVKQWEQRSPAEIYSSPVALDTRHEHVEIADSDLPKLGDKLKRLGIGTTSLFGAPEAVTEWLCPVCKHLQLAPGSCPKHHQPLLTFEEWNSRQTSSFGSFGSFAMWAAIAATAALIGFQMYERFAK